MSEASEVIKKCKAPTAIEAAKRMMIERGYVVVGVMPGAEWLNPGDLLWSWAGKPLPDQHWLRVTKATSAKDWTDQMILIFGNARQNAKIGGRNISNGKYYRAVLVSAVFE